MSQRKDTSTRTDVPIEASQQKFANEDYTVGWICAIEAEYLAAQLCLDEPHPSLACQPSPNDTNTYSLGKINDHNVVVACLPSGSYGTTPAANVATNMLRSFPNVRIGLMVGIGGGAPTSDTDIRLGDIVVSSPGDGTGGVLPHKFGKKVQEQDFQVTGFLNRPPTILLTGLMSLKVDYKRKPGSLEKAIDCILEKEEEELQEELSRPDAKTDILYQSNFVHPTVSKTPCVEAGCLKNPTNSVLSRPARKRPRSPLVHYGLIASGNELMKDALHRDELAEKWNVLCFEMEAAGLMNDFPCLVIRGICDYSDSHKNKEWQGYAAIAAAAYAKDLLYKILPSRVEAEKKISEQIGKLVSEVVDEVCNVKEIVETTENRKLLEHIRSTDPRHDKERIEDTKGGLLANSYRWVFSNATFQQWQQDLHSRLLWVKGDPGKGKTMLLCGIIDELPRSMPKGALLSYFFCQATDSGINTATSVIRGLLYMLVDQQPSLMSDIRRKYNHAGKALFEDANAWVALSEIFISMMQDKGLKTTYLVVDALDECMVDLPKLLDLIVRTSTLSLRVKWLVSSRNESHIEQKLKLVGDEAKLSLELKQNAEQVTQAVDAYIDYKLSCLESLGEADQQKQVRDKLHQKANGTFLWVALVVQELEKFESWDPLAVIEETPTGLFQLYDRMMEQIQRLSAKNVDICQSLLCTTAVAYRPLYLAEIGSLCRSGIQATMSAGTVRKIVAMCGSFLTIRDEQVYLVHQSAKDYLSDKMQAAVLPSQGEMHYNLFTQSLELLSSRLKRDMYHLVEPGCLIEEVRVPNPDPLETARYSCVYWVDHLCELKPKSCNLQAADVVDKFLRKKYLYWLEGLSLCKSVVKGVVLIEKLWSLVQEMCDQDRLTELVQDARRFIMYHKGAIEGYPLQTYASALLFSPTGSVLRQLFQHEEPKGFTIKSIISDSWSACLQTLEGHGGSVNSVAFSHDSTRLASASSDGTVKVWDASSGACLQTLKGHTAVNSVVFSHDSTRLASASAPDLSLTSTFKIWDTSNSACIQTLKVYVGMAGPVTGSVAFSHDSTWLASATGSRDKTVKIWDTSSGACLRTLKDHVNYVNSVVFSHDSTWLASASDDRTIKIWNASSGECLQTLEDQADRDHKIKLSQKLIQPTFAYSYSRFHSVVFSHNSTQLASASNKSTVKIWDVSSGACLQILEGHTNSISSVSFSHNSTQLASASGDRSIKIWDASSGECLQTLKGHTSSVSSVAFSHDSTQLVSASSDMTIKFWDATSSVACLHTLKDHSGSVNSVAFSHNSTQLASASSDRTIKIWDTSSGTCLQTLEGHTGPVYSVTFSHDSTKLVSQSEYATVKVWDASSGACLQTLEGCNRSVAISHNSSRLASVPDDNWTVKIWDASSGECLQTLEGHADNISLVTFSHDSSQLASVSDESIVKIWDTSSGACLQTLEGLSGFDCLAVFSHDSTQLASTLENGTIKIWDVSGGAYTQRLEGHSDFVYSVAFSHDSIKLASQSKDGTVKIWDASSGACLQTLAGYSDYRSLADLNSILASLSSNESVTKLQRPVKQGLAISSDSTWICDNGQNLLWLPAEYRPVGFDISSRFISLGTGVGKVWICRFE